LASKDALKVEQKAFVKAPLTVDQLALMALMMAALLDDLRVDLVVG